MSVQKLDGTTHVLAEVARSSRSAVCLDRPLRRFSQGLRKYTQTFNWAYRDRYLDLAIVQRSFFYTLYLFHKYGGEFRPPEFYMEKFIQAFPMALAEAPDRHYSTSEKTVGRCYAFRSLEGFAEFFGLVEVKVLSKESLARKYEIKKSPLLDALITFRV